VPWPPPSARASRPRPSTAITNLGVEGGAVTPQGEARLKQALAQEPGAPYLNFSLGNLYASQRRWSDAQQAYFNAYRADSRNADYAFNLAVSLDQLGKSRQALEYYRRALELGERQAAAFSAESVRSRIQILEGAGSGEAS
jgi:tetratricopeptide (TPR) repeat protein